MTWRKGTSLRKYDDQVEHANHHFYVLRAGKFSSSMFEYLGYASLHSVMIPDDQMIY